MLGRIQHAFKKREASIVAERDEAVALLRSAPIDPGYVAAEEWEIECAAFLAKLEDKP